MPYLTIMNSVGPHFLSLVWAEYLQQTESHVESTRVRLIMDPEHESFPWSMWQALKGRSWHNWDNVIFSFVDKHVPIAIVAILITTCIGVLLIYMVLNTVFLVLFRSRVLRRLTSALCQRFFRLPFFESVEEEKEDLLPHRRDQ